MTNLNDIALKARFLRHDLNTLDGFPFMKDRDASVELHNKLDCLIVSGFYTGQLSVEYLEKRFEILENDSNEVFTAGKIKHYFGYHPYSGLFIDLTADQFNPDNNPITIVHKNDDGIVYSEKEIDQGATIYCASNFYTITPNITPHRVSVDLSPEKLKPSFRRVYVS